MKKIIITLVSCLLLVACSDESKPFKRVFKDKMIAAFMQASREAEKIMSIYTPPGGSYYLSCMSTHEGQINCQQFFALMLTNLKNDEIFKNMTTKELTDCTLFKALALDYQNVFFDTFED